MKRKMFIVLSLFLAVGTADVAAQSFLKKLEKTVKKEVENRVTNEVKKHVNKVKGDKSQTNLFVQS